jgi:hypothetical protein
MAADVELDVSLLLLRVRLHDFDLAAQLGLLCGDLGEPLSALLGDLGKHALEPRPGCGQEPHEGLVEVGAQLLLERGQQGFEKHVGHLQHTGRNKKQLIMN